MLDYELYPIIAAVKSREDLEIAVRSDVQTIFLLSSNIIDIDAIAELVHKHEKLLFIHMDFVDGLSKDTSGVRYLSTKGIDGIISTRSNIISDQRLFKDLEQLLELLLPRLHCLSSRLFLPFLSLLYFLISLFLL